MIASIVDTDALLEVIGVSIVAGIGLTAVYGVAIVGATRAVDLGRRGATAARSSSARSGSPRWRWCSRRSCSASRR